MKKTPFHNDGFVSRIEAAKRLGVHEGRVLKIAQHNSIRTRSVPGSGRVYYKAEDIARVLKMADGEQPEQDRVLAPWPYQQPSA